MQLCRSSDAPYCDVDMVSQYPSNCTAAPASTPQLSNPGAACASNSDCINDLCTGSICAGNTTGAKCEEHYQCSVGLYCAADDTCQAQISEGGNCYIDYECVNSCGCDKPTFTVGKCKAYYSVDVKSTVQYCVDQGYEAVSRLCETGVCTLATPNVNGLGYCALNIANQKGFASPCLSDSDCVAESADNQTVTGVCECGFGIYGYAYCNAFSGDSPSQTVLSLTKAHLANTTALTTCHTLDRFSADCVSKTLNATAASTLAKTSVLVEDAPAYQDNDYCTEVIFNNDYFEVTEAELSCPSWSCATEGFNMSDNCMVFAEANNSVYLTECAYDKTWWGSVETYCNTSSFTSDYFQTVQCLDVSAPSDLLPGNGCSSASQCRSGICKSSVCIGSAQGVTCNANQDCDVGLFCNSTKACAWLYAAGQAGCASDYECAIGASCYVLEPALTGTCLPMFSQADGTVVPCHFANGNSTLCASGACKLDDGLERTGHCTTVPMLVGEFPLICLSNSDCVGRNSKGESFTGVCKCGYNPYGHSYCTPFAGDVPAAEFLATYRAISQNSLADICHTSERYSAVCIENLAYSKGSNDLSAVRAYYNSTAYGDFINNDQCVQNTTNSYYWTYTPGPTPPSPPDPDDHDDDDDAAVMLLLGGILALA
jgi:hypothetical protein